MKTLKKAILLISALALSVFAQAAEPMTPASPASTADTLAPRVRPEEPMTTGLEIGKSGEDVYIAGDKVGIGVNPPTAKLDVVGNIKSSASLMQGSLVSRPYATWSAGGTSTGAVIIKLPGTTANYGMLHIEINVYEYSGLNSTTYIIGGHNWGNAWHNYGCNTLGLADKPVRLAVKDGQYAIVIGTPTSSWSYGHVVLSKITTGGYYSGVMDLGGTYTITQDASAESYTWISADLNKFNARNAYFAGNVEIAGNLTVTGSFPNNSGWTDGGTNVYLTTTSDNVGIGTTAPGTKLHVADSYPAVMGNDGMLKVKSVSSTYGTETVSLQTSIDNRTDDYTISGYGGDTRHLLALQPQGGYVGIRTEYPQSPLDVVTPANSYVSVGAATMGVGQYAGIHFGYRENNTSYRKSAIVFERTDNSGGGGNAAGKVHILNGPATGSGSATLSDARLTISELGNVGIGTTNPGSYKLNVQGDNGVKIGSATYNANVVFGNSGSWDSGIRVFDNGDAEMRIWHMNASGQIVLATGYNGNMATTMPTDGLFIDQNKVGIGYASPASATGKLVVNGNVGIGRTDPSYLLDVNGTSRFSNNIILPGIGTNEIQYGTGDQANYSTYNFAIRGWWGVAFKDYSNTVHGVYDFRSGNLTTDGVLSFNGSGNNYLAGNLGIGTTGPTEKLNVNGAITTQNGQVKRDFVTWNTTASSSNPIHIKTNITWANIMYRILVEGYNYGAAQPINSEIVGYCYSSSPSEPISASAVNHASGASISQYKSDDGYLCVKLTSSSFYFVGFSVSAWLTNPAGNSFDIKALAIEQSASGFIAYTPGSQTFNYTGSYQTFTVPTGVTSITIQCWGAQGGIGSYTGGNGGYVAGTRAVSAGDVLYVYVGQMPTSTTGGWNGGGNSGGDSRGGGGASDVRVGGTALSNRIIVAGGGGGGGHNGTYSTSIYYGTSGGFGGGLTGGDSPPANGAIGHGGTQSAGGIATGCLEVGTPGSLGQGGNGTVNSTFSNGWSGGGGGGYYGGSGGGTCGAGSGGGGGSSWTGGVTSPTNTANVRSGNGQVIISW